MKIPVTDKDLQYILEIIKDHVAEQRADERLKCAQRARDMFDEDDGAWNARDAGYRIAEVIEQGDV